jgi:hypothetical protein
MDMGCSVDLHSQASLLRREPRKRAVADIVAAGNLAHRLAVAVAASDGLALLVFRHFRFSAELDASGLGAFASFVGAGG